MTKIALALAGGLAALACAGVAAAATDGAGSPTIASDRADYAPGSLVVLTGAGWHAGETVHVVVNDDAGAVWRYATDVTADFDGGVALAFQLPDAVVATYVVSATGASGSAATTTFTDKGDGGSTPPAGAAFTLAVSPGGFALNVMPTFSGSAAAGGTVTLTATSTVTGAVLAQTTTSATCSDSGKCGWGPSQFASLPDGDVVVSATMTGYTGKPLLARFVLDRQPPAVAIRFPANGVTYDAASWDRGCVEKAGICGDAYDPPTGGGAGGAVAIRNATGMWWNGGGFVASSGPLWLAAGGSIWTLAFGHSNLGTFTAFARSTDKAGNVSPVTSVTFTIVGDTQPPTISYSQSPNGANGWYTTPPVIAVSASGPLGRDGWYVGDMTVTTTGSDDLSGPVSCSSPQTVTSDTTGTVVTGSCINQAGLLAIGDLFVKRDATQPQVVVTGVLDGATYLRGSAPVAGCRTEDWTSGVAAEASVTVRGGSVNAVGPYTATCSGATDAAGNGAAPVSAAYTVVYDGVSGILQPINPDGTSVFNRGQAVPVKLSLAGDEGTGGYVTSVWSIARVPTTCTGEAGVEESVGSVTPNTVFRYDAAADQYVSNADFRNATFGSCWRIRVTLDSGQVLESALFRVK